VPLLAVIVAVAVAAAFGVALVVYGIVGQSRAHEAAAGNAGTRVTYRSLADVREQLRRRFEPSGAPVWIAGSQNVSSLAADLVSADLQLRPYEFRIVQAISALLFALVGFLRFGVNIAVLVLAVVGYVLPAVYLRNRRGHRTRQFEAGLPRAMELIANSMRAGQSVAQSLRTVTENGAPPLSDEFGLARREVELGASVDSALSNMVKRIGSSDLRLMVMVVSIQHAVGGDLPAILTTLADTMRQRAEMRAEILAATAQSRASSLIITLLPVAAAAFLYFLVPDYFRPMFFNPIGWFIIGLAAALLIIGNVLIRRMTAIA
jgi:tight adherence protein B